MIWPFTIWKRLGDDLDAAEPVADRLRARCEALEAAAADLHRDKMALAAQLAQACRERDEARNAISEVRGVCGRLSGALATIAAQETPGANGTVKRMARMAREALE